MTFLLGMDLFVFIAWIGTILAAISCVLYGIYHELIKKSEKCGTIVIGGGVPRNWAQQIFPLLDQIDNIETMGYNYSVRIHTATEYDGGLSGCTISESKSWGKYSLDSNYVSVWCDATIALPLLVTGLLERLNLK